jgi:hypothetical protein
LSSLLLQNEDQHALAQEASLLKDEVDILRAAAEKVVSLCCLSDAFSLFNIIFLVKV